METQLQTKNVSLLFFYLFHVQLIKSIAVVAAVVVSVVVVGSFPFI